MRSSHADEFNHDDAAIGYDADVRNEQNPIRAGYDATLEWVASRVTQDRARVIDLGTGTGNLAARLPHAADLACVDVSAKMMALARDKLAGRRVSWHQADLLEFFDSTPDTVDAVVSTYAIHHLTEPERAALFERIRATLVPGGVAAFGDLMFEDAAARDRALGDYRSRGLIDVADSIEEEFFWDVGVAREVLEGLGFSVTTRRISDLSWGIAGVLVGA